MQHLKDQLPLQPSISIGVVFCDIELISHNYQYAGVYSVGDDDWIVI